MPPIFGIYWQFREKLASPVIIRLHGGDRKDMEERTSEVWDRIIEPKDADLAELVKMVSDLRQHKHDIFINVKNHYEGSAPKNIEKIMAFLSHLSL